MDETVEKVLVVVNAYKYNTMTVNTKQKRKTAL